MRFFCLSPVPAKTVSPSSAPLQLQQNKENDVTGYTLYAHALFSETVFYRDVNALRKSFSNRLGSSRSTAKFGYTSNALKRPSPKNVNTAIAQVSTKARDGTDVVIEVVAGFRIIC